MKKWICTVLTFALLLCSLAACAPKKPLTDAQILQERRDIAEAHMRHMMGMLWQTDTDIVYSTHPNSMGVDKDGEDRLIRLEAGKVYSGMPYTHGSGSAEGFLSFAQKDENGIYQLSGMTADHLNGYCGTTPFNVARISNDCADAVSWAWSRVGSSFNFTQTQNMTADRGCLKVGSYAFEDTVYTKTKDVVRENGEEVMYKAYACLQKADAVVSFNGEGHAMMVAQVNVVQEQGVIDPEASYVLVHEQFTANYRNEVTYVDETTGKTVYCLGGVDRKYTFQDLFKKTYVPITIKELVDPAPVEPPDLVDSIKNPDITNLTRGAICCLYQIALVTVTITDAEGNIVQQATCFPKEAEHHMFRMECFEQDFERPVSIGRLDVQSLTPGSYHCTVDCALGNGDVLTARDFDFTVQ